MKKFVRVENGVVMETLLAESLPPFHPSIAQQFQELPVNSPVSQGWTFGNGVFSEPVTPEPPAPKLSDQLKETLLGAIATFKEVLDPEDAVEMRALQKKLEDALPDFEQLYSDQAQVKLAQVAARKLEAWVNPSGTPMLLEMEAIRQGMIQACESLIRAT